ncbi:antiviral RADAR system adenosine triphosphatase RdrA [Catenovulum agarivorans]|uniref:antiviral RADAR system adenosine triphosphatase RdrA n=1 Tax=Catenovulum agarivorans TaxID=1172192 RepID=UPI0003111D23|nr:antiviral RADAR system adenosine triphosphatase RdrA [Catenovulum agarivorans]
MNGMTINLDKPEFATSLEGDEFWQESAWKKLFSILEKSIDVATSYVEMKNSKETVVCHDAIYIDGGRGSGKTIFLKNVRRRWDLEGTDSKRLFITNTIDPTLLHNHDSFANVVVAQIYNEVEDYIKANNVTEDSKRKFYQALKLLADAMTESNDLKGYTGVDRIIKYRSGVQLEKLFHNFITCACDVFSSKALAIPIDDVDMSLSKAFEVLDVVRRLLSCPQIIPIVSGDTSLYEQITELHFRQELGTSYRGEVLASSLNKAYLTKIFPNPNRIRLAGVQEILPTLNIVGMIGVPDYRSFQCKLLERFYHLTNGAERSQSWPTPETPREIQQLLSAINLSTNQSLEEIEWSAFKQWAEQKQHGVAYTNAESVKTYSHINFVDFDISQLIAFSPKMQNAAGFSWASKDFAKEQQRAISRLKSESDQKSNQGILDATLGSTYTVLRSLPPVELFNLKMTVPGTNDGSRVLTLYTHRDFYTTMGNTTAKVFFSRAFELLTASLIYTKQHSQDEWEDYLQSLLNRPPFYCIHALNPTKYFDEVQSLSSSQGNEDNLPDADTNGAIIEIASSMVQWQEKYRNLLNVLGTSPSVLPLIHSVFNKVFTSLQLLRESAEIPYTGETLEDVVKRFEYITVNAFATFLVTDGLIVKANTAQKAKLETLRNHANFGSKDRVVVRNVRTLVDFNSKKAKDHDSYRSVLLEAVWNHPIFDATNSLNSHIHNLWMDNSGMILNKLLEALGVAKRKAVKDKARAIFNTQEIESHISDLESEISGRKLAGGSKEMQILNGLRDALESLGSKNAEN